MTRKAPDTQTLPLWAIWLIAAVAVFALSAFGADGGADDCAGASPRIQPVALPEA